MSKKYQLKNGMQVILSESHKSPVVSIQVWVRTGSTDELKGQEGISHFIEHLLFKGTRKYKVGEIANVIESSGGILNAYTSFDQTVFYVTVSSNYIDQGFDVLYEMMGQPLFDENEINNEREVVVEEIKRSMDNPHQRASRILFSNAFKSHPYGIPVIGYEENIRKMTKKQIVNYFNSRYVPGNMFLLVAGDFKTNEIKNKIENIFTQIKKRKLKSTKKKIEKKQTAPRIKVEKAPFKESILYMSWPGPAAKSKEALGLNLLMMILGQGESSPLNQKVRNEKKLVNHIGASAYMPKDPGLIAIAMGLNDDNLKDALDETMSVILKYLSQPCSTEELNRIVHQLESEKLYSLETVDGLAGQIGHFEFLYKDPDHFDKLLKDIRSITATDLYRFARKYIAPDKTTFSYLTNGDEKKAEQIFRDWLKTFAAKLKSPPHKLQKFKSKAEKRNRAVVWHLPKSDTPSVAQRSVLSCGSTLVQRKFNSSPVVSMRLGFLGGLRAEKKNTRGASELLSRVWACGTHNIAEHEYNQKIESMSSYIAAFGGKNTIGLSLTALQSYFSETLELFLETLHSPALDSHVIEREKQQMLEALRSREDKPSQICMLQFQQAMFAEHPYGWDPLADEEQIKSLDKQNLIQYMSQLISTENLYVSIAGHYKEELLKQEIEKLKDKMPRRNEFHNRFALKSLENDLKIFSPQQKEQSHIIVGYRGLQFNDSNRFVLEIMQSILSGQGGRLFTELRDKASLAYTVAPMRMDGIDAGYFGAYIGCSPEKGTTAIRMMLEEFHKLMNHKVSEIEMNRAKKYLIGRHDISLQKTSSQTDQYFFDTIYGIPLAEVDSYKKHIENVTADEIQLLAQKIFKQNKVISIVGKKDIDTDSL